MDLGDGLGLCLMAFATFTMEVAVLTVILSRSKLLKPLRTWLRAEGAGAIRSHLGELLGCTFCTSIWVATIQWAPLWHGFPHVLLVLFNPLVIAGAAAPLIWLIYNSHNHAGEP